ncbi:MAG: neutral/alkaline non-lysosomal ceramidase N-terminal domain-containing protein [Deltaproteobacteria bacterium]|nr:neutral/alkaline non-lysosomal ceramidase N-terminal domain-containing protein [Deltaproteobacteria bacterium]
MPPCRLALAWVAVVLGAGCHDDSGGPAAAELPYDVICPAPGGACAGNQGQLFVGVAKRDVTPAVTETFRDCGFDGLCPGDADYPGPDAGEDNADYDGHPAIVDGPEKVDDVSGNGFFDAVWIAGYGNDRPAQGVHDPVWARALVLRQGDTTIALVALDAIGYFFDEVAAIRASLDPALGIDLLLVSSTHTHQGPDTVGIWGYDEGTSGVDPAHMARLQVEIKDAVVEAVANLRPAKAFVASGAAGVHPDPEVTAAKGINNLIMDGRDPVVIDSEMRVLSFVAMDGAPIATLVNWQNHPESLCSRNSYISSDFVHYLRLGVEAGVHRAGVDVPGTGGMAIYVNGAVGGMQSPGGIHVVDLDGTVIAETCRHTTSVDDPFFARPRAFGELAALDALRLLADNAVFLTDTSLAFASKRFRLPIENWGYHAMFLTGVFYGRHMYDWDPSQQITESNLPKLETEETVWRLGPVEAITLPGELLPEWYLGGYDGSHTGPAQAVIDAWYNRRPDPATSCSVKGDCVGAALFDGYSCGTSDCVCNDLVCVSDMHNPPDLTRAPGPPYLKDQMRGTYKLVMGLTPDELGYIIPPYDFELDLRQPYVEEAKGDHYEETNSIGVAIGPEVVKRLTALLEVLPR